MTHIYPHSNPSHIGSNCIYNKKQPDKASVCIVKLQYLDLVLSASKMPPKMPTVTVFYVQFFFRIWFKNFNRLVLRKKAAISPQ